MTTLITGANRGIGRALLDAMLADGRDVLGTHRDAANGPFVQLDVTDPDSQCDLAGTLGDRGLDLLVCNAGVLLDGDETLDHGYSPDIWAQSFAVNVTGVFLTVQAVLPHLRRAGGKIVIISSQLGSNTLANGGRYAYRASKAAALNLGRNLAHDLAPKGIAVGIYHPGWVQTDMGGATAAITPEASAAGLIRRFAALSLATTGEFLTWDGQTHPV
ncbi:short-chain dehydrogenase [Loktanella sp. 3ANDIMAR09]|uniref:SDR family oxidoreductase n=1 Tax=Loktanella sp. 3ANDIMAR09 TaxID=1225657 RepID=UPI0006F9122F|nr:SDR family oxidoreductase [Loktanella sp. 3ANDIMAR09]KQI69255.1 short-chain dehydrogenase [Loktanella sp. 3ANDIMAR09]